MRSSQWPIQPAPDSSTTSFKRGNRSKTPNWKSDVKAWRTASGAVTLMRKLSEASVMRPKRPGAAQNGSNLGGMADGRPVLPPDPDSPGLRGCPGADVGTTQSAPE